MKLQTRHSRVNLKYVVLLLLFFVSLTTPIFIQTVNASQVPNVTSPTPAFVNGKEYTVSWTAISGATSYKYESYHDPDGKNKRWQSTFNSSGTTFYGIADSVYYWRVQAIDKNGPISEWSSLWKVTVDSVKPIVNSTVTTTQTSSSTDLTITGSVIETNLQSVSVKLDGVAVDGSQVALNGNDFTISLTDLAIGSHEVKVTATDKAGSVSTEMTYPVTVVDNIAPEISITSPTTNAEFFEDEYVTVTGEATDNHTPLTEVSLTVNSVEKGPITVTNGAFSQNLGKLASGTYAIVAKGNDTAGNTAITQTTTITVKARPVVVPPVVIEPETPTEVPETTPTPSPVTPTPAPAPAPAPVARVQQVASTTSVATETPESDTTVETDTTAEKTALNARAQDIRGTRDSEDTTPTLLGMAWYYWLPIIAAIIFPWIIIAAKKQQKDGEE